MKKYELLALFSLTGTDEEMKSAAQNVAVRIQTAGGSIISSQALQKGRLAYRIRRTRQGYYHLFQLEIDPGNIEELSRQFILAGDMLRFTFAAAGDKFNAPAVSPLRGSAASGRSYGNVPSPHAAVQGSALPERTEPLRSAPAPVEYSESASDKSTVAAKTPLSEKETQKQDPAKVSMEDIDKKLEEILGE